MIAMRWKLSGLMFLGILISYLDRVNILQAIIYISRDLHLDPTQQGIVLSAFSWGYVLLMLPAGWAVDRWGPRIMNTVACVLWSLFTAMTGFANGFIAILASRFLLGAGEAPIFPGNAKATSAWFPVQERGRATAIFDVGSYVGAAVAAPFVIFIMLNWGWQISFWACAVLGLLWSALWYFYYRAPAADTSATHAQDSLAALENRALTPRVKWTSLFTYKTIWGMALGFFCYNYLKSFFLTWFPSYLVTERHFTLLKVGVVSLIPPACAILAELLVGALTDRLIRRGVSVTKARKVPLCVGLVVASVVIGAAYVQSEVFVVGLLALSYAALISASASIWAIPGDVAPHPGLVGSIGGVQNTFSNMAGIVAPIITGVLYSVTGSFILPLILSGVITIVGACSYWFIVGELKPLPPKPGPASTVQAAKGQVLEGELP